MLKTKIPAMSLGQVTMAASRAVAVCGSYSGLQLRDAV